MFPEWTVTVIGLIAAGCTTVAFVPQVVRVWRLKRAEEISETTFIVFTVGMLVWLTYGVLIGSWPVILANAATVVLTVTILTLKWKWERAPASPPS